MDRKNAAAVKLQRQLDRLGQRIVLAESCTAGRIAATLGQLPGISGWLCGGFVVYRNESKAGWLGVARDVLDSPEHGPVSPRVTRLLAEAALKQTPEAALGFAITGDIGPGADAETDGVVFCCLVRRNSESEHESTNSSDVRHGLQCPAPADAADIPARVARLEEATLFALEWITTQLND